MQKKVSTSLLVIVSMTVTILLCYQNEALAQEVNATQTNKTNTTDPSTDLLVNNVYDEEKTVPILKGNQPPVSVTATCLTSQDLPLSGGYVIGSFPSDLIISQNYLSSGASGASQDKGEWTVTAQNKNAANDINLTVKIVCLDR